MVGPGPAPVSPTPEPAPRRAGERGGYSGRVMNTPETPAQQPAQDAAQQPELDPAIRERLKLDPQGLLAAVIQQHDTGEVLMLGWMDPEALRRTLTTGRVTFWSRSHQAYWRKGDTSGHRQYVRSVALDCDGDALLVRVEQIGAACHTGTRTCFDADPLPAVVGDPQEIPADPAAPAADRQPPKEDRP